MKTPSGSVSDSAKPLKIVMVAACPFPANHGSAASIREMSDALARLGHQVHIVTYPISEAIPIGDVSVHRVRVPFLKPGGVKVGPAWEKFLYNPLMILKLIGVIWRHRVDVIHAHNYEGAMVGWFAKLLTRRPMLYNAVNTMADELPTYNFIRPKKFAVWLGKLLDASVPRAGDVITVVSDALRDFLTDSGIDGKKVIVLPAGVNLDMFDDGDAEKIRRRHDVAGVPLVMYTGAIEEFQRIDYLLQAMREVTDAFPDARLMIVGNIFNAAQKDKHLRLARELGILQHVIFVDAVPLDELRDYLAAADVAVVPRPECPGHPVKLLNYMAAGCAIVSFRGGAKGLHHMYNGRLADDHDAAALGANIVFLLQRPELRQALGNQARATIAGNFDWETLARGIEVLYRHLLTGASEIDEVALRQHLREGYTLRHLERRDANPQPHPGGTPRGPDRRVRDVPIDFIERRRMVFGTPPAAVAREAAAAALRPEQRSEQGST